MLRMGFRMETIELSLDGIEKDLLSSIIITYNQKKMLFETIESVLSQDYHKIEIIIADDATPDFETEKVKEYIEDHKNQNLVRIVIIHNSSNYGTVKNINNALCHSKGEYIKIIAGDDCYADPTVFSRQVNCLKDNPSKKIVIGWVQQCDKAMKPVNDQRVIRSNKALKRVLTAGSYKDARQIIRNEDVFPINVQASCYRRSFFIDHGMCDEKYKLIEDTPLMFKVLDHLDEAMEIGRICVLHRGEVGLTTEKGLLNPRREQYQLDNYNIIKEETETHPEVFAAVERIELPRVAYLLYKLTKNKADQKNIMVSIVDLICHADAVLYFAISRYLRKRIR
jgi:glycosyltransferase involved in cell wall biosynthesis